MKILNQFIYFITSSNRTSLNSEKSIDEQLNINKRVKNEEFIQPLTNPTCERRPTGEDIDQVIASLNYQKNLRLTVLMNESMLPNDGNLSSADHKTRENPVTTTDQNERKRCDSPEKPDELERESGGTISVVEQSPDPSERSEEMELTRKKPQKCQECGLLLGGTIRSRTECQKRKKNWPHGTRSWM